MGILDDLIKSTNKMIDEMESDTDKSRSQPFLEKFWEKRNSLEGAIDSSHGEDKNILDNLLNLFNRKGEENDMENW